MQNKNLEKVSCCKCNKVSNVEIDTDDWTCPHCKAICYIVWGKKAIRNIMRDVGLA